MALTLDEVSHIADLARLSLTDTELTLYRDQLSAILDYASRLQQVDTSDIDAASSVLPAESLLREDIPIPGLEIDKVLQNAAKTEKRQFKVPPVFDQ